MRTWQDRLRLKMEKFPKGIVNHFIKDWQEGQDTNSCYVKCLICDKKAHLTFGQNDTILDCSDCGTMNKSEIILSDIEKDKTLKDFMNIKVVRNKHCDGPEVVAYDATKQEIRPLSNIETIEEYMRQYGLYQIWRLKQMYAILEYNPKETISYRNADRQTCLNLYKAPFWMNGAFKDKSVKIKKEENLPKIYQDFFKFFVGENEDSYNYLLDWLANSLQDRNLTILCCIDSVEGLGKGVLHNIMSKVHGRENSLLSLDRVFKTNFNASLKNKTWVAFNELHLKNTDEMNKFKAIIDDPLEIEGKGQDTNYCRNFGNYLCFSNKSDAIKVSPSNRRWSIIDLSDVPLREATWWHQYVNYSNNLDKFINEELLREDNISRLGRYLYYHKIKHYMYSPFISSEKYQTALEGSLNEWQLFLMEEYAGEHKGEFVELEKIQEALKIKCVMEKPPGFRKIRELCKSQKGMEWRSKGNKEMGVYFLDEHLMNT